MTLRAAAPANAYAGFWWRVLAEVLDWSLLWGVESVAESLFNLVTNRRGFRNDAAEWIFTAGLNILYWLYFAMFESSRLQGTPGKKFCNLLVTDAVGNRISFGRATGRYFAKIISILPLFVGFLMAGWTRRKQGLHDLICKTLVLRQSWVPAGGVAPINPTESDG